MEPRLFILAQIDQACRSLTLFDRYSSPSWDDGQFFRAATLRIERGDASVWGELLDRIQADRELAMAICWILYELTVLQESGVGRVLQIRLPPHVKPFMEADEEEFQRLLNVWDRDQVEYPLELPHSFRKSAPLFKTEDVAGDEMPAPNAAAAEIMYVEMKPGLSGAARIGRVRFSQTRKTVYYAGRKLQSLKGGYKANYFDVETAMHYWVSKCKKTGNDTLYPGIVEIDADAREEYWMEIRKQPENKHLTRFRSLGKYSKRSPR